MKRIIECVPNFSEGRDKNIINGIANAIKNVNDVELLNVDSGYDANRTVYTFAGTPENVVEAAFQAIKVASKLIDMRVQKGEHPRIGACDVCPIIPISGVSMEEAIKLSKILGERVASELNVPIYLYEESQPDKSRSNLATIRKGEYEGLKDKMLNEDWKPDYGNEFNPKTGATVIGARDFLIAYNINLETKSEQIAKEIAGEIRESGIILKDEFGNSYRKSGSLRNLKAIGWYMEKLKVVQVSCNLTNFRKTPIHIVFEEVRKKAFEKGTSVTGSELIGLIPLDALKTAGEFYSGDKNIPENELISTAIKHLGLNQIEEFYPNERIIEYKLKSIFG